MAPLRRNDGDLVVLVGYGHDGERVGIHNVVGARIWNVDVLLGEGGAEELGDAVEFGVDVGFVEWGLRGVVGVRVWYGIEGLGEAWVWVVEWLELGF